MKTSELLSPALDWAVAKCEDLLIYKQIGSLAKEHNYSTDWAQGGPIIERENIALRPHYIKGVECVAFMAVPALFNNWKSTGPTPLIAAMRCYVASYLGDEVDIPEELL